METMRNTLVATVTKYDANQYKHCAGKKNRYYNPNALSLYLEAAERATNAVNCGTTRREALLESFSGHLLKDCLKALGMDKATDSLERIDGEIKEAEDQSLAKARQPIG